MRTRPLAPFGAETDDDLRTADPAELRDLLARHGVLVGRGQEIDDDGFVVLLRGLGPLTFTVGETPVEGHPDLNVVTNVGRETPPVSNFHVDTGYVREPPAYTALRAVQVPARGGETVFSDQYAAYDTLPADLRATVEGRTLTHVVTGLDLGPDEERSADHPLFRPHPLTGRIALFLDAPKRCAAISGLTPEQTADVVDALLAHSTKPSNVLRHAWAPGDVVLWDNACVLHRADHDGVEGDRTMHRGMVATHSAA